MNYQDRIDEVFITQQQMIREGKLDPKKIIYIPIALFAKVENLYHISFPEELKMYYSKIGILEKDCFYKSFDWLLNGRENIVYLPFEYYFTEFFATKIIESYFNLISEAKTELEKYTKTLITYFETGEVDDIFYTSGEVTCDYFDQKEDRFLIHFIDEIYQKYKNERCCLNVMLYLNGNCSGPDGLIVKGDRLGNWEVIEENNWPHVNYNGMEIPYTENIYYKHSGKYIKRLDYNKGINIK
ncbi:hypothetical protein [Flammeovirga aprica]|uniref:Uncharacterized protein n=1 Tax=Flammeovirga aprica JL-4 TaxID=694437 RepID=A0A7X9X9S6_9BACT|nr:hypothetical protein [Flammeovirga aprica]NME69041.1 hypothetical protein [Flammeovirga aprica JL-4]